MPARLRTLLALAATALLLTSGTARADEAPEPGPCDFKELGEKCDEYGERGTCVKDTCSRLSYANGTPPESVEYECKRCSTDKRAAVPASPAAAEEPPPSASKGACAVDPTIGGGPLLLVLLAGRRRRRRG